MKLAEMIANVLNTVEKARALGAILDSASSQSVAAIDRLHAAIDRLLALEQELRNCWRNAETQVLALTRLLEGGASPLTHLLGRVNNALDTISRYGGIDGAHHKQWVIDQVVRSLTGTPEAYTAWVAAQRQGADGPDTYEWSEGTPP